MSRYTHSDFSNIHPADDAPTKIGWYATDHCIGLEELQIVHLFAKVPGVTMIFHYWDGRHWLVPTKTEAVYYGTIGCQHVSSSPSGYWFGLKEQAHD